MHQPISSCQGGSHGAQTQAREAGSTPKTGRPFNTIRVLPEQTAYELLRPVVLFGDPAIQRAQETDEPRTSLERKADTFDEQGMVSLFASRPR